MGNAISRFSNRVAPIERMGSLEEERIEENMGTVGEKDELNGVVKYVPYPLPKIGAAEE